MFAVLPSNIIQEDVVSVSIILQFNPLNAELNPICSLLALFGAHHILQVSR